MCRRPACGICHPSVIQVTQLALWLELHSILSLAQGRYSQIAEWILETMGHSAGDGRTIGIICSNSVILQIGKLRPGEGSPRPPGQASWQQPLPLPSILDCT